MFWWFRKHASAVPDLELVPTNMLIREIQRRFDASVFASLSCKTPTDQEFMGRWDGELTRCIGLARRIEKSILRRAKKNETDL